MASDRNDEDRVSSVTSSEDLGFDVNDVNESSQEDSGSPTILRDAKEKNYPPTLQISKLLDGDSGVDIPRESLHVANQFVPAYVLMIYFIKLRTTCTRTCTVSYEIYYIHQNRKYILDKRKMNDSFLPYESQVIEQRGDERDWCVS